jgi:iron complex outermembrane receptor protein
MPTPISESYTLVNARVSVQALSWLNVFVMGNNLLNQQYEINYGYPMPNTYFNTGFKVNI